MREILFRGKNSETNEWWYGDLFHTTKRVFIRRPIPEDLNEPPTCYEHDSVLPETVGQYTGLTDKNGKKIFEGDIVNIAYPDTIIRNAFINYIGASFYGDNGNDLWELDGYYYLEVIGNIHDNPELLGGTNDV